MLKISKKNTYLNKKSIIVMNYIIGFSFDNLKTIRV